jgi:pyruvate carboxylase subunit B
MGGFMPPSDATSLVHALVKQVGLPVVVHTHSSSGMSAMACMAAAHAGATAVDSALSPFAGGTSQPPTESLVGAFRGGPHDPHLDMGELAELAEYFQGVLAHYRPMLDLRSLQTDPGILVHQVPGGMLSNLLSQLKDQDQLARLPEVLAEIPRVRADLGYPPLVTPTSQIVGIQAVVNVLVGARYAQVTREVTDYVRGLYGQPPGPIDPELRAKVLAGAPAITGRPADLLSPEYEKMLGEVRSLVPAASEEEALTYAVFPAVYLAYRRAADQGLTAEVLDAAAAGLLVALRNPTASTGNARGVAAAVRPWARDGRTRLMNGGRWVAETRGRAGR